MSLRDVQVQAGLLRAAVDNADAKVAAASAALTAAKAAASDGSGAAPAVPAEVAGLQAQHADALAERAVA